MDAPQISRKKIRQVIDLKEFLTVDLADKRALKESIGQAFVDHILERTGSGEGMSFSGGTGRPVTLKSPYSKAYAESDEFIAAGKKRTRVNMELTGDMLAAVDISVGRDSKIVIEIDEDQVEKAYNHLTGDTVPRRPWFGLNKSEVKNILKSFSSEIKSAVESDETRARINLIDLFKED